MMNPRGMREPELKPSWVNELQEFQRANQRGGQILGVNPQQKVLRLMGELGLDDWQLTCSGSYTLLHVVGGCF